MKSTINEILICDGETPVSTSEHLDYLFQATKVFNIEQNKTNTHWVCVSILNKILSYEWFLDLLLVDNANFIYSSKNVRRTFNNIM